jgi:hypothetical protein
MRCGVSPFRGGILFACGVVIGLGWQAPAARTAEIAWERVNPFQGCLAAGLDKWLDVQVDTLTNEDPASWRMDDQTVALWTIDALTLCKVKAGGGDEATESRFTRYMAHWRRHIYELVEDVRQKGRPD